MGRLEKIVVLAVLLLVAVVLGVALNTDDPAVMAKKGPLSSGHEEPLKSAVTRAPAYEAPPLADAPPSETERETERNVPRERGGREADLLASRAGNDGPGGLLEASLGANTMPPASVPLSVEPPVAEKQANSAELPTSQPEQPNASGLVTVVGLTPTPLADLMQYTWQSGDEFAALAERFYGSRDRVTRLHAANEGLRDADMRAGSKVWIPTGAQATKKSAPAQWKAGQLYVVQAGDILGKISQTVYGTSRDWRKIYNANRDVLSDPDSLQEGMKLRIPE